MLLNRNSLEVCFTLLLVFAVKIFRRSSDISFEVVSEQRSYQVTVQMQESVCVGYKSHVEPVLWDNNYLTNYKLTVSHWMYKSNLFCKLSWISAHSRYVEGCQFMPPVVAEELLFSLFGAQSPAWIIAKSLYDTNHEYCHRFGWQTTSPFNIMKSHSFSNNAKIRFFKLFPQFAH